DWPRQGKTRETHRHTPARNAGLLQATKSINNVREGHEIEELPQIPAVNAWNLPNRCFHLV
ncbi:MAG: hypothetical protein EBV53_16345, partial [Proteobacteria bacterium]|nr:hypothetical protein [Pseudomonadota bacterium]